MTFIRMTGGRDRGHVKDFPFVTAQELITKGQALPVDMGEKDALAFREIPAPVAEAARPEAAAPPAAITAAPDDLGTHFNRAIERKRRR